MATMVKEKRREKKKSKEKKPTIANEDIDLFIPEECVDEAHIKGAENVASTSEIISDSINKEELRNPSVANALQNDISANTIRLPGAREEGELVLATVRSSTVAKESSYLQALEIVSKENIDTPETTQDNKTPEQIQAEIIQAKCLESHNAQNSYEALNSKLRIRTMGTSQTGHVDLSTEDNMRIGDKVDVLPSNALENMRSQESEDVNTDSAATESQVHDKLNELTLEAQENETENILPSAPMLDEDIDDKDQYRESAPMYEHPKIECLPLNEAIKICGGKEIAEIRAMSEREEMIVEAGPVSGPEHPLVDLLSTFRSSLMALDRERTKLTVGFIEEEKFRGTLWRVEKRHVNMRKKCPCGLNVDLKGVYDYAELLKERLPVAKMRLESLLRDVQESYCHHQHAVLLAHCQIEDLIHQIIQSNKSAIREALALVLDALRLSDGGGASGAGAGALLSAALQRWAKALSAALLDGRDVRQLLHLLHHLFRQTRSVYWAASVLHLNVRDRVEAARAIAIIDLLLNRTKVEPAVECTEEDIGSSEPWEEVTGCGEGAVMAGRCRERDLCALLARLPLRDLGAALTACSAAPDERVADDVLWSCCAVRTLLSALQRAVSAHAQYRRLATHVRAVAVALLNALAAVHLYCRPYYTEDMAVKLGAELEAVFAAGFTLLDAEGLEALPATLLSDDTARDYCLKLIAGLHDKSPKRLESLSIELPVLPCAERVRMVTQVAIDRAHHRYAPSLQNWNELAVTVLEFLFQTGIKCKPMSCKGACESTARELLPSLLAAHPYLYPTTLHMLADLSQVESVDPSCITSLSAGDWRPQPAEAVAALSDWSQRCVHLLPHLLLALDYTPHTGVSLETQLAIGTWLCSHVSQSAVSAEWPWTVLRALRVHRAWWRGGVEAGPPDEEPEDLFTMAYAVLATSWGHSIPIICSDGVHALCKLSKVRCEDAVHCLGPVMLVMANSPESVSLTPKFEELFQIILGYGPSLVQRALGRGPAAGADLLMRLMLHQLETKPSPHSSTPSAILSAWLHALWRPVLVQSGAAPLLDAALLATRNWSQFDAYCTALLMDDNYKDHLNAAVRCSATAPLITECALRCAHSQRETLVWTWPRLLDALHAQRVAGERIHVDNILKLMGTKMTSDELVIFRTANAVLSAPPSHPAHLTLWRLLMYLYLQRPTAAPPACAVGPLFFSGIIKTRTLAQLRKKLQETANYHANERKSLFPKPQEETGERSQNRATSAPVDDSLLSEVSLVDLTGESSDGGSTDVESSDAKSSDSDSNCDSTVTETRDTASALDSETEHLITYHASAERMLREFLTWLELGDKVQAMPHHADISRYIPEQALDAAWKRELNERRPPTAEGEAPVSPVSPVNAAQAPAAKDPLKMRADALKRIKDRSRKRVRRPSIKSPVGDVSFNFRDTRTLLKLVDKHLNEIESLAREWSSEVDRVCCLDERLWSLVTQLRVRRPLPPVKKQCANKCKAITFVMPEEEWCISTGAENGIKENRESARACIRRLSRPRPRAARTVAALSCIIRSIPSSEVATLVCSRLFRGAAQRTVERCPPATTAVEALTADLAERWLCSDGAACAALISTWANSGSTSLQQSLCGAVVSPRRLPPRQWPPLYTAILQSKLPSHAIFSYLSRFEMSRWCEQAEGSQRRDLLEALVAAAQRSGPVPSSEHHVLLELLGVHTTLILDATEVCSHCRRCAIASAAGTLPPQYWDSVARALPRCGSSVPFDQLGHTLRELGMAFWDARASAASNKKRSIDYAMYAPNVAEVLHQLQRAFVAAGMLLTYAPEKVGRYSWSSLQESWSPWIAPHALPPLLPSTADEEEYTAMLQRFVHCIKQVIVDCPGSESILLQQSFAWMTETYTNVYSSRPPPQEGRVQASAALAALADLPWERHQWLGEHSVQIACQISSSGDTEIKSWCAERWRHQRADSWLCGVTHDSVVQRLVALLELFTNMTHAQETLEQATLLPWSRLPELALNDAMHRFFQQYHNPAQPYHELPQFRVLLSAAELCIPPPTSQPPVYTSTTHTKRLTAVSQWTRAASAPALLSHVPGFSEAILNVITDLAPYLDPSCSELEELLSRAAVVMCIEPAAAAVLPVWQRLLPTWPTRVRLACVTAAASLTAFQYYAALTDAAVAAYMAKNDSAGWSAVSPRVLSGPWADAGALCGSAHMHAAYVTAAAPHAPAPRLTAAFNVLSTAPIAFVEKEVITAVWVCLICRVTWQCARVQDSALQPQSAEEARECASRGRELVSSWAAAPRRSIISVVTLQHQNHAPTLKIRLLASLAVCVVTGASESEAAARAYQACCTQVLGSNCHEMSWGSNATPRKVPQLAARLFPAAEKYFKDELEAAATLQL